MVHFLLHQRATTKGLPHLLRPAGEEHDLILEASGVAATSP